MKPPKRESAKNTADEFKMGLEVEGLRQEIVDECGNDSRDTVTLPKEELESKEQILDAARNVSAQQDLSSKKYVLPHRHINSITFKFYTMTIVIVKGFWHNWESHVDVQDKTCAETYSSFVHVDTT